MKKQIKIAMDSFNWNLVDTECRYYNTSEKNKEAIKAFNTKFPSLNPSISILISMAKMKGKPNRFCSLHLCPICRKKLKSASKATCGDKKCVLLKTRETLDTEYGGYGTSSPIIKNRIDHTVKKRYGVENVSQSILIKKKKVATCQQNWGTDYPTQCKKILEKRKENFLAKTGGLYTNDAQTPEGKEKRKETRLIRYGGHHLSDPNSTSRKKMAKTNLERYGVENVSSSKVIKEKRIKTNLKKFGHEYPLEKGSSIRKKVENTNMTLHGSVSPFGDSIVAEKSYLTKKKNNSFSSSRAEEEIYATLLSYFPTVLRQYKDERYPFPCDFYIPINDLFIEYQGYAHHMDRPYTGSKKDDKDTARLRKKNTKFSLDTIKCWTKKDPLKRNTAKKNGLNWLEFFSIKDFKAWIENLNNNVYYKKLNLHFTSQELLREYSLIHSCEPSYTSQPRHNKLVLQYQQDLFYGEEKKAWKDKTIREKLAANRLKYIGKGWGELTAWEVLRGFKISSMLKVTPFSHFSQQWMRKFIADYKVTSIYDPCGGWGHRLTACSKNFPYVYNDIRGKVVSNCAIIAQFLGMTNKTFYNKDAAVLSPPKRYDTVFTCPPYWNTEKYSNIGSENLNYLEFLLWWKNVVLSSCKLRSKKANRPRLFAFVINNKHKKDMVKVCTDLGLRFVDEHAIANAKNHFQRTKNNSFKGESLTVLSIPGE